MHLSNKILLQLISLLLFLFSPKLLPGQYNIDLTLTINTDCHCSKSSIVESRSQFGIYAHVPIYNNSSHYIDTLVTELKVKEKQVLSLKQGTYKLIYTPSDPSKKKSQYYIHLNPSETAVHLNCLFFNKKSSFWKRPLHEQDRFLITSHYIGDVDESSAISTYSLAVIKKKESYFVTFHESISYPHDFHVVANSDPVPVPYPALEKMEALNPKQVKVLKELEATLFQSSDNNNINRDMIVQNSLWINEKPIHFKSGYYTALLWWNKLQEEATHEK